MDLAHPSPYARGRFGFYWIDLTLIGLREIALPAWAAGVAFGACAIASFRAGLRKPSIQLCSQCGYDLRATPHRCPECGAAPER